MTAAMPPSRAITGRRSGTYRPFDPGSGSGGGFSSDRPCLYFMNYHMNSAPTDDTVYYLKE